MNSQESRSVVSAVANSADVEPISTNSQKKLMLYVVAQLFPLNFPSVDQGATFIAPLLLYSTCMWSRKRLNAAIFSDDDVLTQSMIQVKSARLPIIQ